MKVLVTGANGFVGSHLIKKLISLNYEVVAMVRADQEEKGELTCSRSFGDITNYESLKKCAEGCDVIFNVAGFMTTKKSESNKLFATNVEGVKNVIRACEELKIKKLIHVSSSVAIGANEKSTDPLLHEDSVNIVCNCHLDNYDSKRIGEELVVTAAKENRIQAVVVNPALIYGAGDARKKIRKGNILAAKGKMPFYTIGGVSIVSIHDVVDAMITAITEGKSGERYLLTGDNISIRDLLSTISELADAKKPWIPLPKKLLRVLVFFRLLSYENYFSVTAYHWYDHRKAKKELNFHPRSYREAVTESVEWMKKNHYLEN